MSADDMPAFTGQLLSRRSPSPNQTNRNILPPTSTSIELQLTALHSNAYPPLIPLDVASIDLGLLGISPLRSFRDAKPYPSPLQNTTLEALLEPNQKKLCETPTSKFDKLSNDANKHSYDGRYVDARLESVRIRQWTNIFITDEIAARALSLYLVNQTPMLAFFDVDLFLEDLANGGTNFCSRLLVNAVLALACVSLLQSIFDSKLRLWCIS